MANNTSYVRSLVIRLSVNINKIATLRNARGGNIPNVIQVAKDCERFGARGITVHPRPDQRHIRIQDVINLSQCVTTEFNIEGYPSRDFIDLVLKVKPTQVTLVPDPPDVLTSNAGWDVLKESLFLKDIIAEFKQKSIRTSLFIDADLNQIEQVPSTGAERIELYTEDYAKGFAQNPELAIQPYVAAAELAISLNLGVNAGHDLNLDNLPFLAKKIPSLKEVSIGHALIADALYLGLQETISRYLAALKSNSFLKEQG
jgi:pyridoxine 5-phosphate synthase